MRKVWLFSLALLLGLPLLILTSLKLGLATPLLNFVLEKELAGLFNGEVRFGLFRTDVISYAEISDLMVLTGKSGAKLPVLTASGIRLKYSLMDALRGQRAWEDAVKLITIRDLKIFLIRNKKGNWNIREVLKLPSEKEKVTPAGATAAILATRLVLEKSAVIFNDELRDFQSTMENLEGTLDARAFPLVAFSLSGRTEDHKRDNLSLAGEWNAEDESLYARVDLERVPLKTYLNYVLPSGGLRFEDGDASLSVRAAKRGAGSGLDFSGRADVHGGSVKIPGISQPLKNFQGAVVFSRDRLRTTGIQADFLGSTWLASGDLDNLKDPRINLELKNPNVPLNELSQQISGLSLLSLSGTAALSLSVTGQVKDPKVRGRVDASMLRLAGIDLSQVDAEVELDRNGLKVPAIKAQLWGGAVQGSADIRFPNNRLGHSGSLEGVLKGQDIQLLQWSYAGKNYLPVSGTARLDAKVSGKLKTPDVNATLDCPQAYLGNQALGRLQAQAALRGRQLDIDVKTWDSRLAGRLEIILEKGSHFGNSSFSLKGLPLKQLSGALGTAPDSVLTTPELRKLALTRLSHLSGNMDAEIQFSGAFGTPDLRAKLLSRDVRLSVEDGFWKPADKKGLPIAAEGVLRLKNGQLYFGDEDVNKPLRLIVGAGKRAAITLSGPLPMKTLAASREQDKDLKINMDADLGLLEEFASFKKANGKAVLEELRVRGSLDALSADGLLKIKDFSAKMKQGFAEIKHGEAQISIKGKNLEVGKLVFDSGGNVAMTGNLDFSSGIHPYGKLEVNTDAKGLRFDNFAGMIDGSVATDSRNPITMIFNGGDGMSLRGKLKLHDTVFKVANKTASGKDDAEAPRNQATPSMPVELDLRVEIDDNVWLNKQEEDVDLFDFATLPSQILQAGLDNFRSPAFEFRFKPTTEDFIVRGTVKDLDFKGSLGIDRGVLHFQENDFNINQQETQARVIFSGGRRGNVSADAKTQVRYYVNNPMTGKQDSKTVDVKVKVRPLSEEELSKSGLENVFLNYNLHFSSVPAFGTTSEQQESAVLSLLVLGVPMSDVTTPGYVNQRQDGQQSDYSQIVSNQMSKFISSGTRKGIAKYVRGFGSHLFDYFRVSPKLQNQGSSSNSISTDGGSKAVSQQMQQSATAWSWIFEVGKSFYRDWFLTGQVVYLTDNAVNTAKSQNTGPVSMEVRNYGYRAAAEYHYLPTRMAELSYSYSVDDNLEPVAFDPNHSDQSHRYYLGLRNTLPEGNYTPRLARERHLRQMKKELKP